MMKKIAFFWLFMIAAVMSSGPAWAFSSFPAQTTIEDQILEYAEKHLPQSGVLMENADGYVYLKVD